MLILFPLRNIASLRTMEDPYQWEKLSLPEQDFSLEGKITGMVGNYVFVEGATDTINNTVQFFYLEARGRRAMDKNNIGGFSPA